MRHFIRAILFVGVLVVFLNNQTYSISADEIQTNDFSYPKVMLIHLSVGTEAYAHVNNGQYPVDADSLIGHYIMDKETPCGQTLSGYKYDCHFTKEGYAFIATPVVTNGVPRVTTYIIKTKRIFTACVENKCETMDWDKIPITKAEQNWLRKQVYPDVYGGTYKTGDGGIE